MHSSRNNLDLLVGFIDFKDDDTDTYLSFAIYEDGEYADSLTLARSAYDVLLTDAEQGAGISYSDILDSSQRRALLQEASFTGSVLELICESHRFTLDLSKLEGDDIETIQQRLNKLNFDNRFIFRVNGREQRYDIADDTEIALCWYQPEEWEKLKRSADDPENLDDTYTDWTKNANDMISIFRATGQKVKKINVRVEQLNVWCKAEGKENNSAARSRYAAEIARERNRK